jgi:hypothetical protein
MHLQKQPPQQKQKLLPQQLLKQPPPAKPDSHLYLTVYEQGM